MRLDEVYSNPMFFFTSEFLTRARQWHRSRVGGGGGGETRRKIVNVVGIFVVKHRKKWYGNREKCKESNCNVIVKTFLPKKLSTGGNLKCCDPEFFFLRELCISSHWRLGPIWVFAGPP